MPTITFDPPANRADWERACDYFRVVGHPYYAPNMIESPFVPCNLTINPTKPETWLKAVYEAGLEAEYDRWDLELDPHVGRPERPTEMHTGGVTHQPAKKPSKFTTCMFCKCDRAVPVDGLKGFCNCPNCTPGVRCKRDSVTINGVEYRPVPT